MSTDRTRLLQVVREALDRRSFLIAGCVGCVAACGPGSMPDAGDAGGDVTSMGDAPPDVASESGADADAAMASEAGGGEAGEAGAMCDTDGWVEVGPISDYPVGTHRRDAITSLIVTRDARGIWMMRATCNHQFGAIEARTDGSNRCTNTQGGAAMHGATWDGDGTMLVPPGGNPSQRFNLDTYALQICNGTLYIKMSQIVPNGTRLPVP